eukprot:SAG25_NODE_15561_length_106_cov_272.428571_1_plen_35_part_11
MAVASAGGNTKIYVDVGTVDARNATGADAGWGVTW